MLQVTVQASFASPSSPIILRGKELAPLLGAPVSTLNAIARHGAAIEPIPFQVDKRDAQGNYDLSVQGSNPEEMLGAQDETVFLLADAGTRITTLPQAYGQDSVIEIAIADAKTGGQKWAYLTKTTAPDKLKTANKEYVAYDAAQDTIQTNIYRIGFSKSQPFIIDRFQWRLADAGEWSPNLLDTMKIRHHGKFFGKLGFTRTHADYSSRVTAVKTGPVRVIRRTINSVRIISYLKSPSVTIDCIAYVNGFQTDTIVHLPFPLGWFFSDMNALATIDWREQPALPALRVYSANARDTLTINGQMTTEKNRFNTAGGRNFIVESAYGLFLVQLDIEKDLPIKAGNYLHDDRSQVDMPENIPGQFGNVGFMTSGWEKVDTAVHHLQFSVLLVQNSTVQQALGMMDHPLWGPAL